ncbi:hypothetical protein PROVALCAL_03424 [Providencia alcalifaciens DSM 30120]|uniref:Uncharacterized protein n=1 Tax=Providencia alcalifaciens DSM 30120 TaxID=520999 RepID=B6XJ73_9GAMM|nr:hypothetical protein PROVALCAL_03424 [Providencia alcalifaciens DSM 30120]
MFGNPYAQFYKCHSMSGIDKILYNKQVNHNDNKTLAKTKNVLP